ncbi:hypothetical protein NCAS_0A13280 [Naumovozyma castellii]|uniref:Zinc transporter YKE4 n=1 Tax=Naumovozyma castellii TaxID=27288 RepID=G0V8T7_NAUCA|nr:hypothetical protein NCAS_0A13280 [Naumovozyma castellii CBS 4309]CCC67886.1 hypothetical protein NCAS_0A13280 [Naumovozyma castellii CBS 4309]
MKYFIKDSLCFSLTTNTSYRGFRRSFIMVQPAFRNCLLALAALSVFGSAVLAHGNHKNHGADSLDIHSHEYSHKSTHSHSHDHLNINSWIFTMFVQFLESSLFKFSARYNAIIATSFIQILPCLLVLLIPGFRTGNSESNSVMLELLPPFALGTLFGDISLHLLPEIFEHSHKPQQTTYSIFAGFLLFLTLEKMLSILSTDENGNHHSHGHSHSHSHSTTNEKNDPVNQPKISAYLNVIAGLIHNITDGLALSTSFYNSKHTGLITTLAITFHEIPHEISDFAILLSNGFSFSQALKSQIITAMGALIGAMIGCILNEWSVEFNFGIDDSMLPIMTGGFIYMATMGLIPTILNQGDEKKQLSSKTSQLGKWIVSLLCTVSGFALMLTLA